jgi:uncharacterized membrane protein HdeD (DUF308 family)
MFIQLSRHWWWLALRGLIAILFGIIALAWRGDTINSFMLLFGGFALVDGLISIFAALVDVAVKKHWWILLHGLTSLAFSVFTFLRTETAATILLYMVAAWALITGMMEVAGARGLDRYVSNERLLRRSGIASILFAVLVTMLPATGTLSVAQGFAVSAILFGLLTLVLSLNLWNMGKFAHSINHL